jgi:hypothetical protein
MRMARRRARPSARLASAAERGGPDRRSRALRRRRADGGDASRPRPRRGSDTARDMTTVHRATAARAQARAVPARRAPVVRSRRRRLGHKLRHERRLEPSGSSSETSSLGSTSDESNSEGQAPLSPRSAALTAAAGRRATTAREAPIPAVRAAQAVRTAWTAADPARASATFSRAPTPCVHEVAATLSREKQIAQKEIG